jgi:hypothetical protein
LAEMSVDCLDLLSWSCRLYGAEYYAKRRCVSSVGLLKNPGFREIHPDLVGLLGEPHEMLGRKERRQPELFVAGSLRDVLPDDHVLVRVDRVLDLSWLHDEIADLYDAAAGRPSIDPEVAVRLMLAGFLLGIVHDRRRRRSTSRSAGSAAMACTRRCPITRA